MLRNLGPGELLIILAILVVLFGASRLGDLGGAIGRAIREFRREVRDREEPSAVSYTHLTLPTNREV